MKIPEARSEATQETSSNSGTGKISDARRAGALFMFGGLLFLLLTTAVESIYPSFSMQNNAISDLAALGTSTTAIEGTAVLGLAACWIAGG
jgi:hypothetical membrane protein